MRKLVTKDWVQVSPGLVSKGERGFVDIAYTFLGALLLVGSNVVKWSDHLKKKISINNSAEALIPFKEEHQDLLKRVRRLSITY